MEARRKTSPNGWKTASDVACRFAIRLDGIDYSRSSFGFRMDCRSVNGIMANCPAETILTKMLHFFYATLALRVEWVIEISNARGF
jgi:hypothetical protein